MPSRVAPTGGGKGGRGDPSPEEKAAIVAEEVWGMEVAERKRNRRMAVARSVVQGPKKKMLVCMVSKCRFSRALAGRGLPGLFTVFVIVYFATGAVYYRI